MRWILVGVFLGIITSSGYAHECNSPVEQEMITTVTEKIYTISQKHDISIHLLAEKIESLAVDQTFSEQKKCLITAIASAIKAFPISQVQSYAFLYPYYKNTYIPAIDVDVLKHYIFKKKTDEKVVYLTFDDGPSHTGLLEKLKKENIRATFFLLCQNMNQQNMQPYRSDLFSIGGHSVSHDNFDNLTLTQIQEDFASCSRIFAKLGLLFEIFRPPYGIINERETQITQSYGLDTYIWNIDSLDRSGEFTTARIDQIVDTIQPGDIILFHEVVDQVHLFDLIEKLQNKGYAFGKL